jgi:Tol biopolymer transport system component
MPKLQAELSILFVVIALGCTNDSTGVSPAPLPLPLTDRIVFESSAQDSLGDIFAIRTDGTDLRRLTRNNVGEFCPALSPDGNWIAFLQRAPVDPYVSPPSMVLMKADGSEKKILGVYKAANIDGCPVWSRDSQLVAFASPVSEIDRHPNQPLVRTYDAGGSLIAQFTGDQLANYSFSPDNTRFLYSTHGFSVGPAIDFHIGTTTLNGSDNQGVVPAYSGNWQPDGLGIVFDTCGGNCGSQMVTSCPAICIWNTVDHSQRTLATSGRNPVYSPNGDMVAYSCDPNSLCVVSAAGGDITSIPGAGAFIHPVWGPDGKTVGFVCPGGFGVPTDICVADLQTKTITNLTNTPTFESNESNISFSPGPSN